MYTDNQEASFNSLLCLRGFELTSLTSQADYIPLSLAQQYIYWNKQYQKMTLRVPRSRKLQLHSVNIHTEGLYPFRLEREVNLGAMQLGWVCCKRPLMCIFPPVNATQYWVPPCIRELGLCLPNTPHFNYMPFLGISITLKDFCPRFCIPLWCAKLFLSVVHSLNAWPRHMSTRHLVA